MNLEEQFKAYQKGTQPTPQEKHIQETIQKSIEAFLSSEQERALSYYEFLWEQFKRIQKKWWALQMLLLLLLWAVLASAYEDAYIQRSLGIMASIFAILIIPEFWKNRSCHCMEIEKASYYSLRQIYAARMVLFGAVDLLLLTVFCGAVTMGLQIAFTKLLVQFLLPMLVTACICFGTLCSKYRINESGAIFLCILWCAAWLAITLNEKLYAAATMPIWLSCIGLSLGFLCITAYLTLIQCDNDWDVRFDEIKME